MIVSRPTTAYTIHDGTNTRVMDDWNTNGKRLWRKTRKEGWDGGRQVAAVAGWVTSVEVTADRVGPVTA